MTCLVCLALAHASPDSKDAQIVYQQRTIDRLLNDKDTLALKAARLRIAELEEIVRRQNEKLTSRKRAS